MTKNQLRTGLKSNKKIKDSFYHFLIDNRIDWAIVLGSVFCILPYLASEIWIFILIKSLVLLLITLISLQYLKQWDTLRQIDGDLRKTINSLKKNISSEKLKDDNKFLSFQKGFTSKVEFIANDYRNKSKDYKDFEEYLKYDKAMQAEIGEFLNDDFDMSVTVISFTLGLYLSLLDLRTLPKMKLTNYYRLLGILCLTFLFFIIYTIENSI